jgi:hypothetical protein
MYFEKTVSKKLMISAMHPNTRNCKQVKHRNKQHEIPSSVTVTGIYLATL